MKTEMDEKIRQLEIRRFKKFIIVVIALFVLLLAAFSYFALKISVHNTLKEARNITMDFKLLVVEYYGEGKEIYDPMMEDGLAEGIAERLKQLTGDECNVKITGYSYARRKVVSYVYENKNFRVTYSVDQDGNEGYEIDLLFHVASYRYR